MQHLKNESRILFDYQNCFQDWLNNCQLVKPKIGEVKICAESIVFFSSWPSDPRLDRWKADVLYCMTRDFLIKSLAMRAKLVFGIEDIEHALQEIKVFPRFDVDSLRKFREIKSAYRAGNVQPTISYESIDYDVSSIVDGLGLSQGKKEFGSMESFLTNLSARQFNSVYEKLRSLEAAYLIARSNGMYHPAHMSLMKFIKSPNAYGSSQIRSQNKLGGYMDDILAILANKAMHATSA
ncbi:hypothetical protein [Chromohalobacter nigrandesensis]|uniref:hypothetical protein n=1 Tax=Chromohalobacter nigrandesensis TaxID=119863 RepID=UPI001FF1D9C4|nr:hypothetical protein [Chromohalobacter nigrandesensis]MCK0745460.1 hypothetical protein [Chromohalobacter nigrandesensis]